MQRQNGKEGKLEKKVKEKESKYIGGGGEVRKWGKKSMCVIRKSESGVKKKKCLCVFIKKVRKNWLMHQSFYPLKSFCCYLIIKMEKKEEVNDSGSEDNNINQNKLEVSHF